LEIEDSTFSLPTDPAPQ